MGLFLHVDDLMGAKTPAVQRDIKSKYVSLSHSIKLRIYPHMAIILKDGNVRAVNADGAKILRLCSGTITG
ncbi:MAG: hypothetical protein PWP39_142 [Pyrococcus sp.]|uniref:hypothetical protein n=1 Tax=Pyrococcus sp. TaxID=33866 RepID=UPI00258ABF6E|nr:hypothetical protein [Pyrococcus sp.]MDK2868907.1 hypothetical protein [Pyrococcus sp.]